MKFLYINDVRHRDPESDAVIYAHHGCQPNSKGYTRIETRPPKAIPGYVVICDCCRESIGTFEQDRPISSK